MKKNNKLLFFYSCNKNKKKKKTSWKTFERLKHRGASRKKTKDDKDVVRP
jgi:hypothetical protein